MAQMSLEQALQVGLQFHQSGRLKQAEDIYVQVLRHDPTNPDALHLLGVLAHQGNRSDLALELISRAIQVRAGMPVYHYNLAEAYRALRRFAEAEAALRRTLELAPDYVDGLNNLGLVLLELQRPEESRDACRRALELDPKHTAAWNNLGNCLRLLGHLEEAAEAFRKAIEFRPEFANAHNNLGICLAALGRLPEALAAVREAIRIDPASPEAHNNMGTTLLRLGRIDEAASCFHTAIRLRPDYADAKVNMGATLREKGRADQTVQLCEEALAAKPGFAEAHNNLALAYKDMGRYPEALAECEKALGIRPGYTEVIVVKASLLREQRRLEEAKAALRPVVDAGSMHAGALSLMGICLMEQGRPDEAADYYRRSLECNPDVTTFSNLLLNLNYHPDFSCEQVAAEHSRWGRLAEHWFSRVERPRSLRTRDPGRRLRIGYVSPDFKGHAVSHFTQSFLRHHDTAKVEVFLYAHLPQPDAMTLLLRSFGHHWREVTGLPLPQVLQLIADDEIDVLVDLAGHTGFNALPVFAVRAAPVQVSMIGYPNTTGLTTMDYRITDERCDPVGSGDRLSTEKLWRMPGVFWCYTPDDNGLTVGPRAPGGPLRFCSMNNLAKVTPKAIELWSTILLRTPGSVLLLQTGGLNDQSSRDHVCGLFAAHGVDASRLEFSGWTSSADYHKRMLECDIALDTFPFNGGTTTCHKLWMGLPVVALEGGNHVSRMGYSLLHSVGLGDLCAKTHDEYVAIAVALAHDPDRRDSIRMSLRERMRSSPLMDEVGYTRRLEDAFHEMWEKRPRGSG